MANLCSGQRVTINPQGAMRLSEEAIEKVRGVVLVVLGFKDGNILIGPADKGFGLLMAGNEITAY